MFLPFSLLCFSGLFLSVMVVLSSISWYTAWIGLELNLLSFLPLIMTSRMTLSSSEASMKYFLIQALSSVVFLFGSLMSHHGTFFLLLISLALFLKLAAAPLHFWVVSIVEGLSWGSLFLLLTIQKLAPLMVLFSAYPSSETKSLSLLFIMTSSLVGSLGGLSQCMLRSIMAYSSISHMSWLLTSLYISSALTRDYFVFYSLVFLPLAVYFSLFSFYHLSQLGYKMPLLAKTSVFLCLLSLGGLPPFLGFLPKWLVISNLTLSGLLFLALFLVLTSLITLYYYIRLTYSSFMLSSSSLPSPSPVVFPYSFTLWVTILLSLASLPFWAYLFI
uniref:NADH-ubiquinone oxidoreductase chain 2 n=1 Tax=Leptestheria brevirostris TaxID=2653809 RepID=A0A7M1ID01_9CRUS|nr:NADH dehydrogenase subunit 2 [Leptestheria brevirostris]QOQ37305.1 NADH dehydrogenase subunit 2 [Leptestheria brevirostris]